ncbi:MAG: hypothetical protein Q7R41_15195 [Phycisphaerales bacterium]|nr:hypothetical protein [Phycisphaerales bacterium]
MNTSDIRISESTRLQVAERCRQGAGADSAKPECVGEMSVTELHRGLHGLRKVASSAACVVVAFSWGCTNSKKPEIVWTARPAVDWSRIASEPVPELHNEYRILEPQPTVGLFPANLAVTRVAVEEAEGDESKREPTLFADPRNEFLQWNRAFDDQMALSEVFPINHRDLGGGEAEPAQILAAFRALDARLGLIYAVNELSPTESEIIGALYDSSASQQVAAFHAHAVSIQPSEEVKDKDKKKPDLWETDSHALVRAKFEKLVYAALRNLIIHDQPSRTEPPAGWTPAGPIRPVEWPPRHRQPQP